MFWTLVAYSTLLGPADSVAMDSVVVNKSLFGTAAIGSMVSKINVQGKMADNMVASNLVLRQIGPSGVSTFAVRGTAAHQNQVVWNGINLNNPMLGQVDLQCINAGATAQGYVNESANSSIFGSGAIGGTLVVDNKPLFEPKKRLKLAGMMGQYGYQNVWADVLLSNKNWVGTITLNRQVEANNYKLFAFEDKPLNNAAANYTMAETMIGYKHQNLELKWVAQAVNVDRQVPNFGTNFSDLTLDTRSRRTALNAQWVNKHWTHFATLGWFADEYLFTIFDKGEVSRSNTAVLKYNANYTYSANLTLLFMVEGSRSAASNPIYYNNNQRFMNNLAALAAAYYTLGKHKLGFQNRYDAVVNKNIGKLLWEKQTATLTKTYASLGNAYRRATLNELYWQTDVARKLNAESGWTAEIGFVREKNYKWTANVYARSMRDEIMWVPYLGTSVPINTGENKVLGTTAQWGKLGLFKIKQFNTQLRLDYWIADYKGNEKIVGNGAATLQCDYNFKDISLHVTNKYQRVQLPYMEITDQALYAQWDMHLSILKKWGTARAGINNVLDRENYIIGNQQLMRRQGWIKIEINIYNK